MTFSSLTGTVIDGLVLTSIIIPVFNRAKMLQECVASALNQTWPHIEVIIVDDGSTDDTADRAKELADQHRGKVWYVRQENGGPGVARNTGLSHARGQFIQYLDSDDLIEPRKIELQIRSLEEAPDAGVSYCVTMRQDSASREWKPWARTAEQIDRIFPDFLPKRGWATLTPLWRRSACDQIGPWRDFRVLEDWEHDLRAGMFGIKPVWVPEVLAIVRDHEGDRASGARTGFTPALTRDFFRAHESVWLQMRERGLIEWRYLEPFARTMFWIARMCGERGLIEEAERALGYAEEMAQRNGRRSRASVFRLATRTVGWKAAVRISETMRSLRGRLQRQMGEARG